MTLYIVVQQSKATHRGLAAAVYVTEASSKKEALEKAVNTPMTDIGPAPGYKHPIAYEVRDGLSLTI